jgi:NADH/NAD ratio-sensing transcriptional regulator Rex
VRNGPVPDIVVRRLPLYLRTLRQLQREGHRTISSEELAQLLGVTAAQIRRDLSYFGRFGKQGYGYAVAALIHELEVVLHLDRLWNAALVGYGKLGQAIAHYGEFEPNGSASLRSSPRAPSISDRSSTVSSSYRRRRSIESSASKASVSESSPYRPKQRKK